MPIYNVDASLETNPQKKPSFIHPIPVSVEAKALGIQFSELFLKIDTFPVQKSKIKEKINEFLLQISLLKIKESPKTLIPALEKTLFLLEGKITPKAYEAFVKTECHDRVSPGMKILGAIMFALGVIIAVAGVAFGSGLGWGISAVGAVIAGVGMGFFREKKLYEHMMDLKNVHKGSQINLING